MYTAQHGRRTRGRVCCRCLGVPVPQEPFPPPQNEGSREMLMQMFRFIWRNPLASVGARVHHHEGPMLFDSI